MKYRTFIKCTKKFDEIYSHKKATKELQIELDGVKINITEHQFDTPIKQPYIEINIKNKGSYGMDLSTFIKKITE